MKLGIVGGGQLGRMLALAGVPLGLECQFLDPNPEAPAGTIARLNVSAFTDQRALRALARSSAVIGFDWENVSVDSLRKATRGSGARIAPPLRALATGQDRLLEKRLFERLRIPTTRHAAVNSRAALWRAAAAIGLPGVLKTRRMGYDGKGQAVIRKHADLDAAWQALGGLPLLYEEFVPFDLEVSGLGVRARDGTVALYPLVRNWHDRGILRLSMAPWHAPALERQARRHVRAVLREFNYVGVLAVEFFVRNGRLIANELAPRVHNSGHWSIEGAVTSQFENHVRAMAGLPLGSVASTGPSAMINLIGQMPPAAQLLQVPGLHLHDYGKTSRPGRKVGHCTIVAASASERNRLARRVLRALNLRLKQLP